MSSQYDILTFCYTWNDQDNDPRQCAKFGKMCKEHKLALNDHFKGCLAPGCYICMQGGLIHFRRACSHSGEESSLESCQLVESWLYFTSQCLPICNLFWFAFNIWISRSLNFVTFMNHCLMFLATVTNNCWRWSHVSFST